MASHLHKHSVLAGPRPHTPGPLRDYVVQTHITNVYLFEARIAESSSRERCIRKGLFLFGCCIAPELVQQPTETVDGKNIDAI
jgi:hypothetical protein